MTKRFTKYVPDSYNYTSVITIVDHETNKRSGSIDDFVELLNNLHEENQLKLEMIDAFIRGLEDEKGIVPEDREFQCRMNHTIKVLKELKRDMLHPSEFKRLRELE